MTFLLKRQNDKYKKIRCKSGNADLFEDLNNYDLLKNNQCGLL